MDKHIKLLKQLCVDYSEDAAYYAEIARAYDITNYRYHRAMKSTQEDALFYSAIALGLRLSILQLEKEYGRG